MLDGEASEEVIRRALIHMEACPRCRHFFSVIREHVQFHRDLCDPRLLMRSLRSVDGSGVFTKSSIKANLRRLSVFFYQLGKAYLLLATDRRYLLKVFEEPVPPSTFKTRGRGFVDGLFSQAGLGGSGPFPRRSNECFAGKQGYDWVQARSLLNGRLDKVGENLEKARILLEEALIVRPSFAEARLYLGFYFQAHGDLEGAKLQYQRVHETAHKPRNRAHAAIQLGVIMHEMERFEAAIKCFRWVTRSGMVRRDRRFFFVYYNLALLYARVGDFERCAKCFEILSRRFPSQEAEVRGFLQHASAFLDALARQPELVANLARTCPAWFGPGAAFAVSPDFAAANGLQSNENPLAEEGPPKLDGDGSGDYSGRNPR